MAGSEPTIMAGRIISADTYDRGNNKFRTVAIDSSTHAQTTIEYEHHEIHSRSHYNVHSFVDVWPGDADNNGEVDENDFSPVILYNGYYKWGSRIRVWGKFQRDV